MKCCFLLFVCLVISSILPAQDISILIKEAARLENNLDEKAALEKYKEIFKLQPHNITALNKCSELCSRVGKREAVKLSRISYYKNAKNYAVAALAVQPNNSEANCVMAIALGCVALDASSKEKVNSARDIKKFADKAIYYDPMNFKAWHVLGRWHYEVSGLNIFEQAAIKIIFGGLPQSSLRQAIEAFEKANNIKPFAANYFEMARAYRRNGERDKAIATLNALLKLPNGTADDELLKKEGRLLLEKWK